MYIYILIKFSMLGHFLFSLEPFLDLSTPRNFSNAIIDNNNKIRCMSNP